MGYNFNARVIIYAEIHRDNINNIDATEAVYDYIIKNIDRKFTVIPINIDDFENINGDFIDNYIDNNNTKQNNDKDDDNNDDDYDDRGDDWVIIILNDDNLSCYKGRRGYEYGSIPLDCLKNCGIKNYEHITISYHIEGGIDD